MTNLPCEQFVYPHEIQIQDADGVTVAWLLSDQEESAALLVRAVNRDHLFDEMREALEAAGKALDNAEPYHDHLSGPNETDHWEIDPIACASATSHIRAILTKIDEASS